jgi:hypothetical protein
MEGVWFDPKHGGCLRTIDRFGPRAYRIHGVYGDDEGPHTHGYWSAIATPDEGGRFVVDFAGKPIKPVRHLSCRLDGRALRWEDGNVWRKLYAHRAQWRCGVLRGRSYETRGF